jgi:hypothetical protein
VRFSPEDGDDGIESALSSVDAAVHHLPASGRPPQ